MISVVIPSSGSSRMLEKLCESIAQQNLKEDLEVLIVSNPPDATVEHSLKKFGAQFKYFGNTERGANKARNRGIRESQGRIIFFFDDDCELPNPDFLQDGISYFNLHPRVCGLGGPYRPKSSLSEGPAQAYYFIQNRWLFEGLHSGGGHRYLIGGNMALRRSAFEEFGVFDEALVFGGTETEFFRRLQNSALHFLPHRFVFHDYHVSNSSLMRKAFLQGIGRSYSESIHGTNQSATIKWGTTALMKELSIDILPDRWIRRYQAAFNQGEKFYLSTKNTNPSSWQIYFLVYRASLNFLFSKRWQAHLDRMICIIENFRSKNGSR